MICNLFKKNIINFEYTIYGDAEETLSYCRSKGYKNYIISNNFPELPDVIERMGLKKYFVDYFISANIGYEKPRMEIFKYAIEKADYPEVCYMIGDNPIADIQGGKKAGMNVVLIHNKSTNSLIDGYVCDELSDLKDIIKE